MTKVGRKRSPKALREIIQFRLSLQEKNRIKGLAKIYAGGDVSKWLRHGGINAPRRFLK
jgi:hypothetical protein